jgi:hypothetical protein
MPKVHYGNNPRTGYAIIYFTESETRRIVDDSSPIGAIIASLVPEAALRTAILVIAFALRSKARRCLNRGKCLSITVQGLAAIPREYTPGVDDIPPEATWNWS